MVNGRLMKWLSPATGSMHCVESGLSGGGDVRFTSSCFKHVYGVPSCETWMVWSRSAWPTPFTLSPFTGPQRP
jgi:hypothetical protein